MGTTIAFIGFGEVGQLFGRELAARGNAKVAAFDILFSDARRRAALESIAESAHVRFAGTLGEAVRGARLVICAVTADAALTAALEAAPHLGDGQVYIDLNSVSPQTKGRIAAIIGETGADFVEFAVMAPVAGTGIATPILAGGVDADRVAGLLNGLGMRIVVAGSRIGIASATKLCRSIVIKGLEALMVDLSQAGAATGVMPAVLASLSASYPGMDWEALVRTMPGRVTRHGVRRAAEMREAAAMLTEFGLDGDLLRAIADKHERYARQAPGAPLGAD